MAISGGFLNLLGQKISRRRFTAYFSSVGLASTLLPGILWAKVQETDQPINKAVIRPALSLPMKNVK